MEQKKSLALFDFDKTITDTDSFLPFMFFSFGYLKTFSVMILLSFYAFITICGFMSRKSFKEKFFAKTIKGWTTEKFDSVAQKFYEQKVKKRIRKSAIDEIKKHLADGAEVSLVSASPEDWLKPFTDEYGINLIATRLEKTDGIYTGKIVGNNCRKAEKVRRVKEIYNLDDYTEIYAYGDSAGDYEMLKIANHPYFRSFK